MTKYAFPKITGKYQEFLRKLRYLRAQGPLPDLLPIEGTVKLHGIHADIVFDLNDEFSKPQFHSRNRVIAPAEDVSGWPKTLTGMPGASESLQKLKQRVLESFKRRVPSETLNRNEPLIIAGEWVGTGVQRDVGVARLSQRFVILAISINNSWQRGADFSDIEATEINIFSIYRAQPVIVMFNTSDLTETNSALLSMQDAAESAEEACPFAAAFGIRNTAGEGIVWKPAHPLAISDASFWLKTKGPKSGPESRIDSARMADDRNQQLTMNEVCKKWVSHRRIEQAFEYLLEFKVGLGPESLNRFQKWLIEDIMVEEKAEIAQLQQRHAQSSKSLQIQLERQTRHAFLDAASACGVYLSWFSRFETRKL